MLTSEQDDAMTVMPETQPCRVFLISRNETAIDSLKIYFTDSPGSVISEPDRKRGITPLQEQDPFLLRTASDMSTTECGIPIMSEIVSRVSRERFCALNETVFAIK